MTLICVTGIFFFYRFSITVFERTACETFKKDCFLFFCFAFSWRYGVVYVHKNCTQIDENIYIKLRRLTTSSLKQNSLSLSILVINWLTISQPFNILK